MRKIFFLVIVLFAMQHLSAQKFVLMKDTERIESKDSCVYRVDYYTNRVYGTAMGIITIIIFSFLFNKVVDRKSVV